MNILIFHMKHVAASREGREDPMTFLKATLLSFHPPGTSYMQRWGRPSITPLLSSVTSLMTSP